VDFIRKKFGIKKVGHAGTLDPMATGVLVMLLGSLTKSSQSLMSEDKVYEGVITLGATSDTGDAWGRIEKSGLKIDYKKEEIERVFNKFTGELEQAAPMYSAIKHNGQRLYQLARKGITVEVKPRKISVKEIAILNIDLPLVSFRLECSKGTYVRQIAIDIGEALGCGAYLSGLRRTRSGKFDVADAVGLGEIGKLSKADLEKRLYKI